MSNLINWDAILKISLYDPEAFEKIKAARGQEFTWQQLADRIETKLKAGVLEAEEQKIFHLVNQRPNVDEFLKNIARIKEKATRESSKARMWAARWNDPPQEGSTESTSDETSTSISKTYKSDSQLEVEGAYFNFHKLQIEILSPTFRTMNENAPRNLRQLALNRQFSAKIIFLFLNIVYNRGLGFIETSKEAIKLLKLFDFLKIEEDYQVVVEKWLIKKLHDIKNKLTPPSSNEAIKEFTYILNGAQDAHNKTVTAECIHLLLQNEQISHSQDFNDGCFYLNLSACGDALSLEMLNKLCTLQLSNLTELELPKNCLWLMDRHLEDFKKNFPHLLRINIENCPRITDVGIRALCLHRPLELTVFPLDLVFNSGCDAIRSVNNAFRGETELDASDCVLMTDEDLEEILSRIDTDKIKALNLSHCTQLTQKGVLKALEKCPKLIKLDLSYLVNQVSGSIIEKFPDSLKELYLDHCNKLVNADLGMLSTNCSNLETLSIRACNSLNGDILYNTPLFPNLTSLNAEALNCNDKQFKLFIEKYPHIKHLRVGYCSELTTISIKNIGTKCTSLQTLCIDGIDVDENDLLPVLQKNNNLEILSISFCTQLTDKTLIELGKSCQKLKEIYLHIPQRFANRISSRINKNYSDYGIGKFAEGCTQLEVFVYEQCAALNDKALIELGTHCPHLKKFVISRNANFTVQGLKALIEQKSDAEIDQLQHLHVVECKLLDRDVLHKLISMQFNFNSQTKLSKLHELRTLTWHGDLIKDAPHHAYLNDESATLLSENCPRLEELNTNRVQFSQEGLRLLLTRLSQLERFRCTEIRRISTGIFSPFGEFGTHLRLLDLSCMVYAEAVNKDVILQKELPENIIKCQALQVLTVGASTLQPQQLLYIIPNLTQIVELGVYPPNAEHQPITGSVIAQISTRKQTLRFVDFGGGTNISVTNLQDLLMNNLNLRLIIAGDLSISMTKLPHPAQCVLEDQFRPVDAELP